MTVDRTTVGLLMAILVACGAVVPHRSFVEAVRQGIRLSQSSGVQGTTIPTLSIDGVNSSDIDMTQWVVTIDGEGVGLTVIDRSPARLVVRVEILCNAPAGRRTIGLMPPGATLAKFTAPFGVVAPTPTLTSLTSSSQPINTVRSRLPISSGFLTGTDLRCATAMIENRRADESIAWGLSTATSMPLSLTMVSSRPSEVRRLVVDVGGRRATLAVTVTNPRPTVIGVSPSAVGTGRSIVTVTGTEFADPSGTVATVALENARAGESVSVQTSSAIALVLAVNVRSLGLRAITVTTDGGTASAPLTVFLTAAPVSPRPPVDPVSPRLPLPPPPPVTLEALSTDTGRVCDNNAAFRVVAHIPQGWYYSQAEPHTVAYQWFLDSAPGPVSGGDFIGIRINTLPLGTYAEDLRLFLTEGQHTLRVEAFEGLYSQVHGNPTHTTPTLASAEVRVTVEECMPRVVNFRADRYIVGPGDTVTVTFELRGDVYGWRLIESRVSDAFGRRERFSDGHVIHVTETLSFEYDALRAYLVFAGGAEIRLSLRVLNSDNTVYPAEASPAVFAGPVIGVQIPEGERRKGARGPQPHVVSRLASARRAVDGLINDAGEGEAVDQASSPARATIVASSTPEVCAICGWLSDARSCASRLNRVSPAYRSAVGVNPNRLKT